MATLPVDYAIAEQERENIMQSENDTETKQTNLIALRSFVQSDKTLSSFQVISALLNTMIGSGVLLLPYLFITCGVVTSIYVILVICFSCCETCVLLCIHSRDDDDDVLPLLKKFVGDLSCTIYKVFNMLILLAVGLALYLFSVNMFFGGGSYLCRLMNVTVAGPEELSFNKFSIQYAAIAVAFVSFGLLLIKDIKIIIEIGKYGSFGLHGFTLFVIYYAVIAMMKSEFSFGNLKLFDFDFLPICGLMSTAFQIHPTVVQTVKKHKNPELIERDVYIVYAITLVMYIGYGLFGAIAILDIYDPKKDIFTDYFPSLPGFVVQVLFFVTLISAFPILVFCGRISFFDVFFEGKVEKCSLLVFNVIYTVAISILAIFGIKILPVVGFAGAVFGFYIAYVSPILIHFGCLKNMEKYEKNDNSESLLSTCNHKKPTFSKPVLIIYYGTVFVIGVFLLSQEIYKTAFTVIHLVIK